MFCGENCAEKLRKIVFVGSGPIIYFCFTMAAYAVYKHYANYKSPNHQEKIIGTSPPWPLIPTLIRSHFPGLLRHLRTQPPGLTVPRTFPPYL